MSDGKTPLRGSHATLKAQLSALTSQVASLQSQMHTLAAKLTAAIPQMPPAKQPEAQRQVHEIVDKAKEVGNGKPKTRQWWESTKSWIKGVGQWAYNLGLACWQGAWQGLGIIWRTFSTCVKAIMIGVVGILDTITDVLNAMSGGRLTGRPEADVSGTTEYIRPSNVIELRPRNVANAGFEQALAA